MQGIFNSHTWNLTSSLMGLDYLTHQLLHNVKAALSKVGMAILSGDKHRTAHAWDWEFKRKIFSVLLFIRYIVRIKTYFKSSNHTNLPEKPKDRPRRKRNQLTAKPMKNINKEKDLDSTPIIARPKTQRRHWSTQQPDVLSNTAVAQHRSKISIVPQYSYLHW